MPDPTTSDALHPRPIATLWKLGWDGTTLACVIYRNQAGLQLRVESPTATIMNEPFEMQPRMFARSHALRDSLKRRGWQDVSA